ncbi:MAG TPA: alpha/beta hydrolase [Chloroflexota bacterium]|jgi:4,5:9,10-diseco-3-hydroxy-5,9,17-trioxoandrosta-1(10),2-diene-4-oate hydrolase|nr:alpha/beta hydrolase [Chloroflexota bacterium]
MALTKEQTDRFIEVDGIRLHYNEAGSGPALICTHGGGPGANAWDNTKWCFDALAQHFRTILLDLPGFGESQKGVSRGGVPMDIFCARLKRDFMDQLGIERAHLYGSSAFSAAALRFGIEYPDRVGKIIIQAYAPGAAHRQTEGLKALATFAQNPTRENMETMMAMFVPREERRPASFVEARFKMALTPGHLESRREMSASSNSDLTPDLHRLRAPVLMVWGEADLVIPVEDVLEGLRRIPNVRAHIWGDRTGHFVAYEHADEFARVVIDFLSH